MNNRFVRRLLGFITIIGVFLTLMPSIASAASLPAPSNVTISGGIYTNDTTPTVTWTRSSRATWYAVSLDAENPINLGNVTSYTFWSLTNGWHTASVRAHDDNGRISNVASVTFEIDTVGPTVPAVSPSSAIEDQSVTFSVTPSGESATTFCDLYVGGSNVGSMTKNGLTFTKTYTFANDGNYSVYARCIDGDGNTTNGTSRTVRVSNSILFDAEAPRGSLVKIVCGANATSTDICKAVYFYGNDGKRHVFPNEGAFFSWYTDFDSVIEVSNDFMSSLSIGKNVTYRPGSVVIKFDSLSDVYAVQADHTLHHYLTLSLLKSDYGTNWTESLAKVPDSLYSNYTIGSDIDSTNDFDRDDAYFSVSTIDDIL